MIDLSKVVIPPGTNPGDHCTSGCRSRDHMSYAECLQSKSVRPFMANTASGHDYTAEKKNQRELNAYADARRQGVQPATTRSNSIERAMKISDATGVAYQA